MAKKTTQPRRKRCSVCEQLRDPTTLDEQKRCHTCRKKIKSVQQTFDIQPKSALDEVATRMVKANEQEAEEAERAIKKALESPAIKQIARNLKEAAKQPADPIQKSNLEKSRGTTLTVDGPVKSTIQSNQMKISSTEKMTMTSSTPTSSTATTTSLLSQQIKQDKQASTSVGYPHLIIEARAGTGKTTTLVEGLKRVKGLLSTLIPSPQQAAVWEQMELSRNAKTVCFVAFNKAIAEELKRRVPQGCEASTMHSMGFKAVGRAFSSLRVNSYRVQDIISELLERDIRELRRSKPIVIKAVEELVGLCKMNLIGIDLAGDKCRWDTNGWTNDLIDLSSYYDVDLNGNSREVFDLVPRVLERCKQVDQDKCLDFNDMVYLPVALNLPIFRYDLLLVDECVPGFTPVMLGDGSSITIQEIVEGRKSVKVRSYDVNRKQARNCKVIGWHKILNHKQLVKISTRSRGMRKGSHPYSNFVICTTDHQVWTSNRGWVEAGSIVLGDMAQIETSAKTTQLGKITSQGRHKLSVQTAENVKQGKMGGFKTNPKILPQNRWVSGHPTLPQQVLRDALGDGWIIEYALPLSKSARRKTENPNARYRIDIANPEKKMAVEVDGQSHKRLYKTDEQKTRLLESLGWKVVRVSNRRAIQDTDRVVCEIIGNCPCTAEVIATSPVDIKDDYVYDITVEDCHNFYANGVLVHNCQDLNRCQQELAKRAGKRLVFCGDPKQAIYGFAGADAKSMQRLEKDLSATEQGCVHLPLTVTRRCGKAIVKEAQKYVPDFEAFAENCGGKVSYARM